ncbi:MAG: tetratricopeptide repeat protein [Flavobacteriales bacterium]|nr:tetratricopeptide repeat protein [Flavobacteriales bacterium]
MMKNSTTTWLSAVVLIAGTIAPRSVAIAQENSATRMTIADTSRIGTLHRKADLHFLLMQLDSAKQCAFMALAAVDSLIAAMGPASDRAVSTGLSLLRARTVALLGRAQHSRAGYMHLFEALELFHSLNDSLGEANTYGDLANIEQDEGRYLEAIRHVRQAHEIQQALGLDLQAAHSTNAIGINYRLMGDPANALERHLVALPVIQLLGTRSDIAWNCILIGAVHRSTKDWPNALKYFAMARANYQLTTDSLGLAVSYNDLGTAHYGAGDLDSALYWHGSAAALRERIGSFDGLGHSLRYIGRIHQKKGNAQLAIDNYQLAIASYARVPMPTAVANTHGAIAEVQLSRGNGTAAIAELNAALAMLRGSDDHTDEPQLWYRLGSTHARMAAFKQAVSAYEQGLTVAGKLKDPFMLAAGYDSTYQLHASLGDHRSAYLAYEKFIVARDSVRGRAKESRVVQLMMKHDLEQDMILQRAEDDARRSKENSELDDKRAQMYVYIAGAALFMVLALALVARLRFMTRVRNRLERQRIELQEAMARAERSEKFKERFLANMSHEIRTPMNAIMGMSGIMLRNEHLPKQEAQLEAVRDNADRLLRTLNDILDLSKMDAGMLQPESIALDPRVILERVLAAWRSTCEVKGVRLSIEVAPEVPHLIMGDPTRLEQVLSNLVQTAIKFTDSGSIHVQASAGGTTGDKFLVCFSVHDTGVGMSPARMEGIFGEINQDYSVGRKKRGDIGLGLTISKRLTELMGGTMEISSEEGKGSTFKATIPFTTCTTVSNAQATSPRHHDLRELRILLAEDNAFNVMVAQDELNDAIPGVVVDVAVDGREALSMVKEHTYDVVLMDVQMPEMNGYDATKAIRSLPGNMSHVPIIAMTANAMQADLDRCKEAGMNGYVPKPFKREELLVALQGALSTSRSEA